MKVRVLGVGMGPQHVTPEVADALRSCDYVLAADKGPANGADNGLLAVRRAIAAAHGVEVVTVRDPERDRADPADYPAAVRDWHEARVAAYEQVLRLRGGDAALLVWGDPSLYDSTIRVVEQLAERLPIDFDVMPGISAPQLLAARHRMVLHDVGVPVHVTTARRLREDIAAGQTNLVLMLAGSLELSGLEEWSIWSGVNLGTDSEELVSGLVCDVLADLDAALDRAKQTAGWVLHVHLLRAPG